MATDYLEVKKANDCQTRTLVRMCHNYKNIALVMEIFDDKTGLWRSENSFNLTIIFIKPISDYTKQHDIFQLTRTPKKFGVSWITLFATILWMHYTYQIEKRRCENLIQANPKIVCRLWQWLHWNLGKSARRVRRSRANIRILGFWWTFDQSQQDLETIKTPEKQLPLISNNFSDDLDLDETPRSSLCYAPAKKLKLSQF